MKLNELNTFFDSISPTSEQKERMLANILNYHEGEKEMKKAARKISMAGIIVAALVLTATGVFAANAGGFDWLIKRFNPPLGEVAAKVEAACVDQDIRMEVMGAQIFDNAAVIYLSLQDLSGQNRITERTDFNGSLDVKANIPEDVHSWGFGIGRDLLYFDNETNTAYYEMTLQNDWPLAAPLEISSSGLCFDETDYDNAIVDFDLSAVAETAGIDVDENKISSWTPLNDGRERDMLTKMLGEGSLHEPLPHGDTRQLISNAGIIDGWLHLRIESVYGEFGPSSPSLRLLAPDGTEVEGYNVSFFADKNGDILDNDSVDENIAYAYDNIAFPVDTVSLSGYSLIYNGSVSSGIAGNWAVKADTGDVTSQLRIFTDALNLNGMIFEDASLSPLGLSARGSYLNDSTHDLNPNLEVILETDNGEINLGTGSVSVDSPTQTFSYFWEAEDPLDVSTVKAIRVNGVYMDME